MVGVIEEMPIKLGLKEVNSATSFLWSMLHAGQSIIFISWPSCSSTAAMYVNPRGGRKGWCSVFFKRGGLTNATLVFIFYTCLVASWFRKLFGM